MGILALSTANSVNTKHSMLLRGRGPDWSIIPSSGKSGKSKAEFTLQARQNWNISIGGGRRALPKRSLPRQGAER